MLHDHAALAQLSLARLQQVVAIDSQSDETSTSIPSTDGQRVLADFVGGLFAASGCAVERDAHANVIASLPGRGVGVDAPPIALMVHLDTARGTGNPPSLHTHPAWDGSAVSFPENPSIRVDTAHYKDLAEFVGHTIVHGDGRVPFGLDDKLGLTHLLTVAELLAADTELPHPPVLFIGRPDEEIGRMEAVEGLAAVLAERGVRSGYTVDGILPFEVNVQNFNGGHATATFKRVTKAWPKDFGAFRVVIGGVNTHGATAHAEGHRGAVRLGAELLAALMAAGVPAHAHSFQSDALRDCDAVLVLGLASSDEGQLQSALDRVVGPHIARGASYSYSALAEAPADTDAATARILTAVLDFAASRTDMPLFAEDSSGWQGYSHPYRARMGDDAVTLDIRIRDFDAAHLETRKTHVLGFFKLHAPDVHVVAKNQYVNMGPRLAHRRDLVDVAVAAGEAVSVAVREMPIRGGTGVDPFLDRGVAIANLGTGYFAPESEKELTSLELMVGHARWLVALLGLLAEARGTPEA